MFEIEIEAQFKADYRRTMRIHPQLKTEFKAAVAELAATARFPRNMVPTSFQTRATTTTVTSISIYPMAWSTWSFSICRIRLIL